MQNITKNLQLALLTIILISTVIAVGIEIRTMFSNMSVTLADLLLMFLYLEVLAMVRVFLGSAVNQHYLAIINSYNSFGSIYYITR